MCERAFSGKPGPGPDGTAATGDSALPAPGRRAHAVGRAPLLRLRAPLSRHGGGRRCGRPDHRDD